MASSSGVTERRGIPAAAFVEDVQSYLTQSGLDVNSSLVFLQESEAMIGDELVSIQHDGDALRQRWMMCDLNNDDDEIAKSGHSDGRNGSSKVAMLSNFDKDDGACPVLQCAR
ncbi:hypothetical protein F0562_005884 [Nyssa sinensis]|uniref:Uncharacterized protein n=1 Tax=Nyssa sinensis TaxID=561372 RepID=A0A5J5AN54_9ASTE|nr:hypothetical protein F0562_005884 [Nyssa sinensis]